MADNVRGVEDPRSESKARDSDMKAMSDYTSNLSFSNILESPSQG